MQDMILIDVFVAARKRFGSQAKLAKAAGVSQQLIGEIERGRVRSTKKIFKIASALNMSANQLNPDIPALDDEFEEQLIQVREMTPEESAFVLRGLRDLIKMARRKPKLVSDNGPDRPHNSPPAPHKNVR